MKKLFSILTVIIVALVSVVPASATTPTGTGGIFSVAACKDITTVAVSGTSGWATTRIVVTIYYLDSQGNWVWLKQAISSNFGSGSFNIPVTANYSKKAVAENTLLQINVELQHLSGNSFVDFATDTTTVTVADKNCVNKCSVTLTTSDRAPVDGIITLRSHFGSWFRPEGRLYSAIPVNAGQAAHITTIAVSCDVTVRAWYYPASGKDRTPKMLPAQYWPGEFAATTADGSIPYATSFAKGLPATRPLESDDPYAPK
jgi:hypothetical protein